MATKKTTKPKASDYTKQIATRMDVVAFARLLASSLGNDRWFTEDVIKNTFKQSGSDSTVKKDSPKATKIPNLESDSKVMDSLLSIHDLLKKNYQDRLKSDGKKNQFRVEQSIERKKQSDDFIKALQSAGGTSTVVNNTTATKVNDDSDGGLLEDLLGLSKIGRMLFGIAEFFLATPLGLGLLLGLSAMYMLGKDSNPERTTKSILAAGDLGEANKQMMDVVENTTGVERRKQNLLADRPMSKKSFNVFNPTKEIELQKQYLQEIGFDEKTGLTQAEKNEGYTGVDTDGNPIKLKATPAATTPSEVMGSPAATSVPTESSLSKGESVVSTPSEMPAQVSTSNMAQKFDMVNSENLEMKLPQTPSDKGMMITNNEKTQSKKGSTKVALPSVRNAEETFQRMILNSTRVV